MTATARADTPTFGAAPAVARLRERLRWNAAFSVTSGLLTVALAGWVADRLGTDRSGWVALGGVALVVYSIDLLLTARMRWARLSPAATLVVAADAAWVIGTVVVLALGLVDGWGGRALLVGVGVIVLELAIVQARALGAARRATPDASA